MYALVHGPLTALGKVCVAAREIAFKRLFSCVGPNVVLQGVLARKAYSTMFAYKRLFVIVTAHVPDHVLLKNRFAASWVIAYLLLFLNCLSYRGWRGCSHLLYVFCGSACASVNNAARIAANLLVRTMTSSSE